MWGEVVRGFRALEVWRFGELGQPGGIQGMGGGGGDGDFLGFGRV